MNLCFVDAEKWSRMPSEEDIASAAQATAAGGINVVRVNDGESALNKIKENRKVRHPGERVAEWTIQN